MAISYAVLVVGIGFYAFAINGLIDTISNMF